MTAFGYAELYVVNDRVCLLTMTPTLAEYVERRLKDVAPGTRVAWRRPENSGFVKPCSFGFETGAASPQHLVYMLASELMHAGWEPLAPRDDTHSRFCFKKQFPEPEKEKRKK